MKFNFENLDEQTRSAMLTEVKLTLIEKRFITVNASPNTGELSI